MDAAAESQEASALQVQRPRHIDPTGGQWGKGRRQRLRRRSQRAPLPLRRDQHLRLEHSALDLALALYRSGGARARPDKDTIPFGDEGALVRATRPMRLCL